MSIAGTPGTNAGAGDPSNRAPIRQIPKPQSPTLGTPTTKRPVEVSPDEEVTVHFNPSTPEDWRATVPPVIQLVASSIMSVEEARDRLKMGPKKKGDTFMPVPPEGMTPGQANKITTNPRTQGGVSAPKGLVSKPPEQQEKPKEAKRWRFQENTDGSILAEVLD